MRLITDTPQFTNDICEVVRLFDPQAVVKLDEGDELLRHEHADLGDQWRETWSLGDHTAVLTATPARGGLVEKRMLKRAVKSGCFDLFCEITGQTPPWGSLTGIRPTRLLYEAMADGQTLENGTAWLTDTFHVSPERARLLSDIVTSQRGLIERDAAEFDLYIGIPFCVTRCAYCSFSAGALGDGHLVEPYLAALFKEMDACAEMTKSLGLRVRACYMGGGTPTSLSAEQLERTIKRAQEAFPGAREWTVEAGRPDTIDEAKLAALLRRGVDRISVNPQTFSDETLVRIGRAHNSDDTRRAFALARAMGFAHINMDLIAALPGEDEAIFDATLAQTLSLRPESVTVHTLAIKRASKLHEIGYAAQPDTAMAQRMVDLARARLEAAGYRPYYLYRQKYMAGNLENVGYALPGKACLYNIDIMEETTPILALGACGITKWLFPRILRIERAPNVKSIEGYIERVDEMIERKRALILEDR